MTKTAKQKRGVIITVAILAALVTGFYFLLFIMTSIRG